MSCILHLIGIFCVVLISKDRIVQLGCGERAVRFSIENAEYKMVMGREYWMSGVNILFVYIRYRVIIEK